MNFRTTILEFDLSSDEACDWPKKIAFEDEDSGFAPEPSVACGLRSENGLEFGLIYLQKRKRLLIYGEKDAPVELMKDVFLSIYPELKQYISANLFSIVPTL